MRRWHDGTGMGPVWQAIIFLGGIIPALLSVTGIIIWWRSRGARARAQDYRQNGAALQAADVLALQERRLERLAQLAVGECGGPALHARILEPVEVRLVERAPDGKDVAERPVGAGGIEHEGDVAWVCERCADDFEKYHDDAKRDVLERIEINFKFYRDELKCARIEAATKAH